jgi:hypothetical protein
MQNYETNPRPAQVATTTRAINIRPILAPVQATGGMRSSDVMDNIGEKSRAGDVNASPRRPGYKRRGFNPVYGISETGLEELSFMFQSESQQRIGPDQFQLLADAGPMRLDGSRMDIQFSRDPLGRFARRDHAQNPPFRAAHGVWIKA